MKVENPFILFLFLYLRFFASLHLCVKKITILKHKVWMYSYDDHKTGTVERPR